VRRYDNAERKAGNIAEMGNGRTSAMDLRVLIVLDADSLMGAECLFMTRRMSADAALV